MGRIGWLVGFALIAVACTSSADTTTGTGAASPDSSIGAQQTTDPLPPTTVPSLAELFGEAPAVPDGPLSMEATAIIDSVFDRLDRPISASQLTAFAGTEDARVGWLIADLLRFSAEPAVNQAAASAASALTGVDFTGPVAWVAITDHLIAWDTPAFPGYEFYKQTLFTTIEPRWEFAFTQPSAIDYRLLSWGGVLPDDRPYGDPAPCPRSCIPALDDPTVTNADGGDWYPDDRIVFGVEIDGEARAYPKNIMEIHEMVNDTLGGRDFALPYCTLCGSAQVFFTDRVEGFERPILRTSGLLSRSNKVMYDLNTGSVFDTFRGDAVTGPMYEADIVLDQGTVVVSTWGDWKESHPDTTIVAQDGGIGRSYDLDPLGGRDDEGPIFPIGDRDLRLPIQEQIVGVISAVGTPVAFPADAARVLIESGGTVDAAGITLEIDGSGLVARDSDGNQVASHQAFWFAWSQFHPETLLWSAPGG